MGKKKKVAGVAVEEENKEGEEGKNLLGEPTFKQLENGRFKCVETGHELTADARASYAHSKHCRLGLIDSALARSKPPLNMFQQDPQSRSRLICKLTGHNVNKTEEHIWKHINGKRFLSMLGTYVSVLRFGDKWKLFDLLEGFNEVTNIVSHDIEYVTCSLLIFKGKTSDRFKRYG